MKTKGKHILIAIGIILIAIFLNSCGVRKSELKKETEVLKTKVDSLSLEIIKLKEKKTVKRSFVKKNNVLTKKQELKLTPKDSLKPIKVVDSEGKETSYFNATVEIKKEHKQDNTETKKETEKETKKALESNKKTDLNKDIEVKKEVKEKVTENKNGWTKYIPFSIFFVLLILFFFFKNKIPFINKLFSK